MTTTQEISQRVIELVENGMDVIEAMKTVCGAENVETMIDSLYNELRAA